MVFDKACVDEESNAPWRYPHEQQSLDAQHEVKVVEMRAKSMLAVLQVVEMDMERRNDGKGMEGSMRDMEMACMDQEPGQEHLQV
jgi:hypothetical protein